MSRITQHGLVALVIALVLTRWVWPLSTLAVWTIAIGAFIIVRKISLWIWLDSPEGMAFQNVIAQREAEAAQVAHQEYVANMQAMIVGEYRERVGDPYAEVPQAWLLYRWAELEKEAADAQRHREALAQQNAIAFQQGFQGAFQTGQIVNAIHHQNEAPRMLGIGRPIT